MMLSNRPRRNLAVSVAGAVLLTAFVLAHPSRSVHASPPARVSFVSEAGGHMGSIYDGLPADPELLIRLRRVRAQRPASSCSKPESSIERALSLLGLSVRTVHAQGGCEWSCGAYGCGALPDEASCSRINCQGGGYTDGYTTNENSAYGDTGEGTQCTNCGSACFAGECSDCQH